jgi:hypothetical protein
MKNSINKEKLEKYITRKPSDWLAQADYYKINKDSLDKSTLIAIKQLSTNVV